MIAWRTGLRLAVVLLALLPAATAHAAVPAAPTVTKAMLDETAKTLDIEFSVTDVPGRVLVFEPRGTEFAGCGSGAYLSTATVTIDASGNATGKVQTYGFDSYQFISATMRDPNTNESSAFSDCIPINRVNSPLPLFELSGDDLTVTEGTRGTVPITRTGNEQAMKNDVTIKIGALELYGAPDSATGRMDFDDAPDNAIGMPGGQTSGEYSFPVFDDKIVEPNERFVLYLPGDGGLGEYRVSDRKIIVTIVDNDVAAPAATPTPAPTPTPAAKPPVPVVKAELRVRSLQTVLNARGILASVSCSLACNANLTLKQGKVVVGTATRSLRVGVKTLVRVTLDKKTVKAIRKKRSVRLNLEVSATSNGSEPGKASASRTFKLGRTVSPR